MSTAIDLFHRLPEPVRAIRSGQERHALIADALTELFHPLVAHHRTEIQAMLARNVAIKGTAHDHFLFRGEMFPSRRDPEIVSRDTVRLASHHRRKHEIQLIACETLHPDLRGDMALLLDDLVEAEDHFDQARNYLSDVLLLCRTIPDVRSVLPVCLHPILDTFTARCSFFPHCTDTGAPHHLEPGHLALIREKGARGIDAIDTRFALNLLF